MTDRELLEAAAKAAGYVMSPDRFVGDYWVKDGRIWNPLTDDGDALRLAVKLRLDIVQFEFGDCEVWCATDDPIGECLARVKSDDTGCDHYAATRRAIVRAAAAIGGKS